MTPKFRIYDKDTSSYIQQSSSRFLISSSGRLYDAIKFEWHDIGDRYVVEMQLNWASEDVVLVYDGDVLSCTNPNDGEVYITSFGSRPIDGIYFNNNAPSFELSLYGYSFPSDIKIIGTIHDEKYK